MDQPIFGRVTSRRRILTSALGLGGAALVVACGQAAAPSPPAAPAATAAPAAAPAAAAAPTATTATGVAAAAATATPVAVAATAPSPTSAGNVAAAATPAGLKAVPRNRTLMMMWSGGSTPTHVDWDLWSEYTPGSSHQNGLGLLYEPVAYYSAFADKEYPWLVQSYEYNTDFTQLTMKVRSGISWSDGTPFSADDIAYTLNTLRDLGPKVVWGAETAQFVKEATASTADTVVVQFKSPAPRFFFFLTYKYDIGVPIVPKHIFSQQPDWTTFKNFDISKGWPVTTGPWQVAFSSPDQKIIDRRDTWWAATAGLANLPQVERIVYLPFAGETQTAQAVITNLVDTSLDLRPETIKTVIEKNPAVATWTKGQPPYGYQDWWPSSLFFNCEKPPFNNPDVRWATSYYINRQQAIDVAYGGASILSPLPMPQYPPLQKYFDGVKDLLAQYPTNEYNPAKGDALLQKAGYKKGSDGIWADAQGTKLSTAILGWTVFADIGPVIAAQLKKNGIDASYSQPPDAGDRQSKGDFTTFLSGHGGSVRDPYDTLHLYQSESVAVPGSHQVNFSRWVNKDYDAVVDQVYLTPMENTGKLTDLFHQAMQIWLPNLPDAQIDEWYHRIPMNQTNWTNWPNQDNPYINAAFWHYTFQLLLNNLKPVS